MNAFTRMSDKGQVVVPKAIRETKGWPAGTDLEVIDTGEGILLRPRRTASRKLTIEEAIARLRAIHVHRGPSVPVEQLGWSVDVGDGER